MTIRSCARCWRSTSPRRGSDDYLAKPFSPRELVARIRAVLRRMPGEGQSASGLILWGPLRLDLRARRADVADRDLELTSAELRILELLVRADTRTVTRDELMTQALGRRLLPTDRSLDTHVSNLRRKLMKHTDRVTLQSVRGSGYALALALILVGTVTVAVNATAHRTDRPWVQRGQLYAQAARAFESGGPEALRSWLQSLPAEPFGRTFVVEPAGRERLGRPLPPPLSGSRDTAAASGGAIAPIGGALVLVAAGGSTYHVVIGPVHASPRLLGELELPGVPLTVLAIALGVSAAVCFFLARYLASPVERLRLATRQLASGDLNVRVLPALRGRQDDLGLLAADLDTMAERLRLQLEAKRQLLRDVSHELRSPLARLQLALSLARREDGAVERHLARIECEAQRLEALIARTLKLVSLERPVHALEQASVDVGELLRTIVADVAIEADAQGCLVRLQTQGALVASGDPELLRSAL